MATKFAPHNLVNFVANSAMTFSAGDDLYAVSEKSQRAIRAHHLTPLRASAGLFIWALERLCISPLFTRKHWEALSQFARLPEGGGYMEFERRMYQAISPAIGDNTAWRADESKLSGILSRADKAAAELLEVINMSSELDIELEDACLLDKRLERLAELSKGLYRSEHEPLTAKVRERAKDESLSAKKKISLALQEGVDAYSPPRLSTFLNALRERIAGRLPERDMFTGMLAPLGELKESEKDKLLQRFGLDLHAGPRRRRPPKIHTGGNFGKYPQRKKALRHAVMWNVAADIFSIYSHPPKYKASAFMDGLSLAWFGESPGEKEWDTFVRDLRKEQSLGATEREGWEEILRDAEPDTGKVPKKKPQISGRRS